VATYLPSTAQWLAIRQRLVVLDINRVLRYEFTDAILEILIPSAAG
jgi:hypothetical protein